MRCRNNHCIPEKPGLLPVVRSKAELFQRAFTKEVSGGWTLAFISFPPHKDLPLLLYAVRGETAQMRGVSLWPGSQRSLGD